MNDLIQHPAMWPLLSIDPEPFACAADPESSERLYSELYGYDSDRRLINGGPMKTGLQKRFGSGGDGKV